MESVDLNRDELYRKVARKIIPFLFAGYVLSQIDRANIGFAKLQFVQDLDITEAAFGLAAGMFSLGYILFEVPSNLMLHRIGVRLTLLRIMIAWGACTTLLMFAQSATHMYVLRFLLGLAEAGFFPGILFYITYWFPNDRRGRATTLFVTAVPIAGAIGGPLAGLIMDGLHNVYGLRGWQWVFLLEGLPTIVMGFVCYLCLSDRPRDADWLSEAEKKAIETDLDESNKVAKEPVNFGEVLRRPTVWLFTLIYLGFYFSLTSIAIWWPTLLKSVGASTATMTGFLSGAVSAVAAIGMILIGRSSDRLGERRWHVALSGLVGAAGFLSLSFVKDSLPATVLVMMVATTGVVTVLGLFWTIPQQSLLGRGAAGGIAVISSIGNLAGFFAPVLIGTIKDRTGSLYIGLAIVAVLLIFAMIGLLLVVPKASKTQGSSNAISENAHA